MLTSRSARFVVAVLVTASVALLFQAHARVPVAQSASGRVVIPGHLVPALHGLQPQHPTDGSKVLQLTIALNLRNRAALDSLVAAQNDLSSPWYHQYITPQEFTDNFGPTQATVNAVVSFLHSQGITVQSVTPNRALIDATATVATVERAFDVRIADYVTRDERQVYAPTNEPSAPASLGGLIQDIGGLSDVAVPHRAQSVSRRLVGQAIRAGTIRPDTGGGPVGGYTPAQLRTGYDINTLVNSHNGATQTVAFFKEDGYLASDVNTYRSYYGLGSANYSYVLVDRSSFSSGQWADETESDMEVLSAIAPGASQLVYIAPYAGFTDYRHTVQYFEDGFSKIVNDNLATVVSTSWGICEVNVSGGDLDALDVIFTQGAVQGQAFFAASGDSGADDCGGSTPAVDFPASDPHVIGVGGTTLYLNSDNTYSVEYGWSGSGGGNSAHFSRPAFQAGLNPSGAGANSRLVPDISADADAATPYSAYCTVGVSGGCTGWTTLNGTSLAAPLWAGIAADTDDYLVSLGRFTLGTAIGVLYQIYNGAGPATAFHDIGPGWSNGYYQTDYGYDLVTGIGTPDAWGFAQDAASIRPLYEQTPVTDSHEVYVIGNNLHVYVYHWSASGGWSSPVDLTSLVGPSGVTFSNAVSGHSSVESGNLVQHAYAVGSDGNLYEYYNISGTWHLTTLHPPSGVTFAGTPSSFSYSYPGDTTTHHSVFVVGSNYHLYLYAWAQGGGWSWQDLTSAVGLSGVSFYYGPSGHWLIQSGGLVQDIYVVGNDGLLHEFWSFGGSTTNPTLVWHHGTLSPPSGVWFTGTPSGFSWFNPGSATAHHSVFVLGSDFYLYNEAWSQSGGWSRTDLTATYGPSGVSFTGVPSGHALIQSGGLVQDDYTLTTQSQLYEYYQQNGSWGTNQVSRYLSGTNVGSSPSAYSYILTGTSGVRHSVFFIGGDGHLHELYWLQSGGGWYSVDHGAPSGTSLATAAPSAYGYCSTLNC